MTEKSAYATLNLRKGVSDSQIKEAYLTLVKRYDPERHTDRFMVIQSAFERLSDPIKKAREDVLTFNPVLGQFQFLDEEKENLPETEINSKVRTAERQVAEGADSDEIYQSLCISLMQRSAFHIRRKLYQKAIESWERILQIEPTHQRAKGNLIFAYSSLAYSYASHELYDEAMELWVKASQMNPDDDDILHNLALACEKNSKKEEAEKYWAETIRRWNKSLERNPDDEYMRNCILEVHRHHGVQALDRSAVSQGESQPRSSSKAVEEYKEILKIKPDDFEAQFQVAASHMEKHEFPAAAEALKNMTRKYPKNVEVLNLMGWALLNSGQIDSAFQIWRHSTKIDPKNSSTKDNIVRAHLELGKKCREQGQFNSALKHFKSLLKLLGMKNAEVHFEIGHTYYMKGDRRSAYLCFQTVMKLDPKNAGAKKMLQELRMR